MKLLSLQAVLFLAIASILLGEDVLNRQKDESATSYLARLEKAGNEGNAFAFYKLGEVYEDGLIVKKNEATALLWYEKSAKRGDKEGLARSGYFYSLGIGTESDPKKACIYYEKSAEQGVYHAAYSLGLAYAKGRGVEKDMDKSNDWFEKAYELGDREQKVSVAEYFVLFRQGTPYEARGVKILEDAAAKHDDTEAQRFLGTSYYLQERTYNREKAFNYLKKAADKGNIKAKTALGQMYMRGDALPGMDEKKGLELWLQASETDAYPRAVFYTGMYYLARQRDEPGGVKTAFAYLERAAKLGFPEAQYTVGMACLDGQYVRLDIKRGAQLMEKAAEAGYPQAQMMMAKLYYQGKGVPQDFDKMKTMLEKAAAQNEYAAKELLKNLNDLGELRVKLGD